jgi:hypothetical protein
MSVEKAQTDRRYAMNRTSDLRMELASTLVGPIGAQWRRRMLLAYRNTVAVAVDSRRRSIDDRDFLTIA